MREFIQVYEELSEDGAYEHINPNLITRLHIDGVDSENNMVIVATFDIQQNINYYDFKDFQEAKRFINRVSGKI